MGRKKKRRKVSKKRRKVSKKEKLPKVFEDKKVIYTEHIPIDIVCEIGSFLDGEFIIKTMMKVCKEWRICLDRDSLWKTRCIGLMKYYEDDTNFILTTKKKKRRRRRTMFGFVDISDEEDSKSKDTSKDTGPPVLYKPRHYDNYPSYFSDKLKFKFAWCFYSCKCGLCGKRLGYGPYGYSRYRSVTRKVKECVRCLYFPLYICKLRCLNHRVFLKTGLDRRFCLTNKDLKRENVQPIETSYKPVFFREHIYEIFDVDQLEEKRKRRNKRVKSNTLKKINAIKDQESELIRKLQKHRTFSFQKANQIVQENLRERVVSSVSGAGKASGDSSFVDGLVRNFYVIKKRKDLGYLYLKRKTGLEKNDFNDLEKKRIQLILGLEEHHPQYGNLILDHKTMENRIRKANGRLMTPVKKNIWISSSSSSSSSSSEEKMEYLDEIDVDVDMNEKRVSEPEQFDVEGNKVLSDSMIDGLNRFIEFREKKKLEKEEFVKLCETEFGWVDFENSVLPVTKEIIESGKLPEKSQKPIYSSMSRSIQPNYVKSNIKEYQKIYLREKRVEKEVESWGIQYSKISHHSSLGEARAFIKGFSKDTFWNVMFNCFQKFSKESKSKIVESSEFDVSESEIIVKQALEDILLPPIQPTEKTPIFEDLKFPNFPKKDGDGDDDSVKIVKAGDKDSIMLDEEEEEDEDEGEENSVEENTKRKSLEIGEDKYYNFFGQEISQSERKNLLNRIWNVFESGDFSVNRRGYYGRYMRHHASNSDKLLRRFIYNKLMSVDRTIPYCDSDEEEEIRRKMEERMEDENNEVVEVKKKSKKKKKKRKRKSRKKIEQQEEEEESSENKKTKKSRKRKKRSTNKNVVIEENTDDDKNDGDFIIPSKNPSSEEEDDDVIIVDSDHDENVELINSDEGTSVEEEKEEEDVIEEKMKDEDEDEKDEKPKTPTRRSTRLKGRKKTDYSQM